MRCAEARRVDPNGSMARGVEPVVLSGQYSAGSMRIKFGLLWSEHVTSMSFRPVIYT